VLPASNGATVGQERLTPVRNPSQKLGRPGVPFHLYFRTVFGRFEGLPLDKTPTEMP
jgi:hypothetical protein